MSDLLGKNWLTMQPIDFEYKQYLLLAYKQNQLKKFEKNLLYPAINDLKSHKEYVDSFINNINDIENSKVETIGINWIEMKLVYKSLINDGTLDEIKKIAIFSKTIIDELHQMFTGLYETIENNMNIEGYMLGSTFKYYSGYIVFTHNVSTTYYEYHIKKEYYPEPVYILELEEISEKTFYANRYIRNYFNVTAIMDYPFENAVKPVFKRKFLSHLIKSYH